MEKLHEKKNFGIPVTLLTLFAYLIGYSLTKSISGTLLVAILFAGIVFGFQFDDKVKNAVKNSYVVGIMIQLIYFLIQLIESLINTVNGGKINTSFNSLSDLFYGYTSALNVMSFISFLVNAFVIVIYSIFIIMALMGKDVNIGFISNIFGERSKNINNPNPTYNQPPVAPNNHAPVNQNGTCPNCGRVNNSEAVFCGSCGTKLK